MMVLRSVATGPPHIPAGDGGYAAGTCNIGPAEIARRRRAGDAGVVGTIALFVVLLVIDAPPAARLLVALPAAGAAIGYLQARLRFCAAFGLTGVFNFGPLGRVEAVRDHVSRTRDRAMAVRIALAGIGLGIVVGLVAVALPV